MTTTLLTTAYKAVDDKKGEDIVVLNMEGVSLIADQFIICHANSERQVQAIAKEVADKAAEAGYTVKRIGRGGNGEMGTCRSWRCCRTCLPSR